MTVASLGLFDTLVPIASIVSISLIVGYTLPRHETFGLFLLVWWASSVAISLQNDLFCDPDRWSNGAADEAQFRIEDGKHAILESARQDSSSSSSFLSTTDTSADDRIGMVILIGMPLFFSSVLYVWFLRSDKLRKFLLQHVPLYGYIGLNMYRLDGLSLLRPVGDGRIPKFLGYQMLVLDTVFVGMLSIPLTLIVFAREERPMMQLPSLPSSNRTTRWRRFRNAARRMQSCGATIVHMLLDLIEAIVPLSTAALKDALWYWNTLGCYNLISAYVLLCVNYLHAEGTPTVFTTPALSRIGFHPLPLLALFHAPVAVLIHLLLLSTANSCGASTNGNEGPPTSNRSRRNQHPIDRLRATKLNRNGGGRQFATKPKSLLPLVHA